MPHDPHAQFDQSVMEMIEHSPVGAVPHTTSYVEALTRLYANHQVYPAADHKGGHVTARSLSGRPSFCAGNLETLGSSGPSAVLESNERIFDRYLQSLPARDRPRAESLRLKVTGKPIHHRKHHGPATEQAHRDPVHSLFLIPGTGLHHGLPGNYLFGSLFESSADPPGSWAIQVHDSDDGASFFECADFATALAKLQELFESAPFHLRELDSLGFKMS